MLKNIDFVQYWPKTDCSWNFTIMGKARKASEEYVEILKMTEKIFTIFKDFYKPTKISYSLYTYSEDVLVNKLFERSKDPSYKHIVKDVKKNNTITYNDLIHDIQNIGALDCVKSIGSINFEEGKTKFILNGKEVYIDKESPKELYSIWANSKFLDIPDKLDPLKMSISTDSLSISREKDGNIDRAIYKISIYTYTDMWFSNSIIGLKNKNSLRNVLKNIYNNFEVTETLFQSDIYSEKEVEQIVFG